MTNVSQASNWLARGSSIAWENGQFVKCSTVENVKRFCMPNRHAREIEKITQFVQKQLEEVSVEQRSELLELAERLIVHYHKNSSTLKLMQVFERSIARYQEDPHFNCKVNQMSLEKWLYSGMPSHIFYKYPDFCTFLERSYLLSQIKVTRDIVYEDDNEPALIVNGNLMKWSAFKETFEVKYSKLYKEYFIVHKQTRDTYTYLDNGRGLQPHHPFLAGFVPISKLGDGELTLVCQKASEFVRPGEEVLSEEERQQLNKERPHVLQLVSSCIKGAGSNFGALINAKHPYIRIISGVNNPSVTAVKGDVFEVGYGWKEKMLIPFETIHGHFRSPDIWEYQNCDERLVTNIPISNQEAVDLCAFTMRYHRDEIHLGNSVAFHLFRQNCSTYVRTALQVAGIHVPTEMVLPAVLREIAPEWMCRIGRGVDQVREVTHLSLRKVSEIFLPAPIKNSLHWAASKVMSIFEKIVAGITALGLAPIGVALGGTIGVGGRAFVLPGAPEETVEPPLKNWKNWFDLSGYTINLPYVLQCWQRQQASTVVYPNPIKLTLVPFQNQ